MNMNTIYRGSLTKIVSWTLICTLLSSCATPQQHDPMVAAERKKFETRNTYIEGVGAGMVIGAVVGGVIGAGVSVLAHQSPVTGLIGGAAAGGLIGAGAGAGFAHKRVQERKAALAQEGTLNDEIADARSARSAAREYNNMLSQRLDNEQIEANQRAGALSDSKAVLNDLDREIEREKQYIAGAQSSSMSDSDRRDLGIEIQGLEGEQTQLENNINRLRGSGVIVPSRTSEEVGVTQNAN
jgi:hypothetical protein